MKRFYSLVLMAVALLVGTNAWAAQVRTVSTAGEFETAWKALQNGDEIRLMDTVSIGKMLWLGTTTMADANPLSVTLNLNGYKLIGTATKMFLITHGELNVISENGEGTIEHTAGQGAMKSAYEIFRVLGSTYKDVDPKNLGENQKYYSHLVIGENVKLIASNNAIVVDQLNALSSTDNPKWDIADAWAAGNVAVPSLTTIKTNVYRSDRGVANGVCIDVKGKIEAQKYAIKANGNLGIPSQNTSSNYPLSTQYQDRNGTAYEIVEGEQKVYSPFIHIHSTAELLTKNVSSTASIAAYSGGYARWLVEGTCIGSTGVYVKSGEIVISNATIASNYTGTYVAAEEDRTSGVDAGGSGIVLTTATAYAGDIDVTVQGDTKVSGTCGYAIDESVVASNDSTKVDAITITGGTFEAGDKGTMHITEVTVQAALDEDQETIITIIGGQSITEKADSVGNMSLAEFLADADNKGQQAAGETHITYVENEEGKTVMVISQGTAPLVNNKVSEAGADASIKWQGTIVKDTINSNLRLTELEINDTITAAEALADASLTAGDPRTQILVINSGKTLEVGRVILGKGAQIIVEAGGKFIVTGTQGIVAPVTSNIILRTEEGNPAIFVFHPNVTSNRHPNATVEFISKSYVNGSNYATQRFGIPANGALTAIDAVDPDDESIKIRARFYDFNYANNSWNTLGYINGTNSDAALNLAQMAEPFAYYQMYNYRTTPGTKVIMKGALVGNEIPNLGVRENFWNGYANSCMGLMNIPELLDMIPNTVDKAIYLYDVDQIQATWEPLTKLDEDASILPLQPFLIRNTKAAADVEIDYADAVYYPTTGETKPGATAPARRNALSNITKAKMVVKGENNIDRVTVAESEDFSAEFDNGYEAVKYMNDGINMYVTSNEKMSVFATDNLENTYVGFQTVNGGTYTIEFANVQGEELTLIDLETGAQVAMVEGNVYEFTADANTTNDYRFQIVETRKIATGVENTEAIKSVKGIYTITGQYVGEMNVWNTLPAGVYVVNGEKRVK